MRTPRYMTKRTLEPPRQLTRLSRSLWVDLDAVESVETYTDRGSYNRMVRVTTTSGQIHTVTAVNVGRILSAAVNDRDLDEYLRQHFGALLGGDGQ